MIYDASYHHWNRELRHAETHGGNEPRKDAWRAGDRVKTSASKSSQEAVGDVHLCSLVTDSVLSAANGTHASPQPVLECDTGGQCHEVLTVTMPCE